MSAENEPKPVLQGSAFAAMLSEMIAATRELDARRSFCDEVSAFLKDQKLTKKFEAWRAKKKG